MKSLLPRAAARGLVLALAAFPSLLSATGTALTVKTVPWVATNPLISHVTYSGKQITLKGTCDQQAANIQWTWDFGDGSPAATGTNGNMWALEATHAYTGAIGTVYTARLTVNNTDTGESASRPYYIQMFAKSLDVEVDIAIDEGLWYLHKTQHRTTEGGIDYGDWNAWVGYDNAARNDAHCQTAANLNAFQVNGHLESGASDNPYTDTVARGMRRVFTHLAWRTLSLQNNIIGPNQNPDTDGNGIGLFVAQGNSYYQGGMFMDAIVASGTPNAVTTTGGANVLGRTYKEIVQDMADDHAAAQYDGTPGGGWRYSFNDYPDNSACQWAAIGLIAAEKWGCVIPAWVKQTNIPWLAATQRWDGAFGYTDTNPAWGPYATTPSGMVQMALDGIGRGTTDPDPANPPAYPSWDKAETFIRNNFANTGDASVAIKSYYYGLLSFVKSMLLHSGGSITLLQSSTPGVAPLDWYAAEAAKGDPTDGVARTLVNGQSTAGYWWGHNYDGRQFSFETPWAILMLHRTIFETGLPVAVAKCIPSPGVVGQEITFDGSDSYHQDPAKNIVNWEWDLDADGSFETSGAFASTSFLAIGNYPIKLRVTDDGSPATTAETTVMVLITTPPVAPTADANGPYNFCPLVPHWFLDGRHSVNPDDNLSEPHDPPYPGDRIQEYAWDLDGDNDFNDAFGPTPDVTEFFQTAGPGSYKISLRVTDTTATSFPSSGYADQTSIASADVTVLDGSSGECDYAGLTATPGLKNVLLAWPDHPMAAYYNVYRSTTSGGPYTWIHDTTGLSYTDEPGVLPQVYYYVVRPAKANGDELVQSNEAFAEPLHPRPVVTATIATTISNSRRDYYQLDASSQCFGRMQLQIFVGDTASSQVAGPYFDDDIVRIRRGATPLIQPGLAKLGIDAFIQVVGQARVWAVDPIAQTSEEVRVP